MWDLAAGRALRTLRGHAAPVSGVAAMPPGTRAVSVSLDRTLTVWNLNTGRGLRTFEDRSQFYSVAVTPDGTRAVCGSGDKLKVWDLDTGRVLRTLEGHSGPVDGVAVTPDGKRAVSASEDKALKVWDLNTGLLIATFHCDGCACCCAFADERRIVAGDSVGHVYILSLEERR